MEALKEKAESMNDEQLMRYSRQIMLPDFDIAGQEALLKSRVLILGLGGLGCPAALYLGAAGVGHLILADGDQVELSNLQRQIAHRGNSLGEYKVNSAASSIRALNPDVNITPICENLTGSALAETVAAVDLVVDASDNFAVRFALNSACIEHRVPLVSGAAIRLEGQISVFDLRNTESPCYACLYPQGSSSDLSCSESGVLAPLVGVIGSLQAMEAIKLLTSLGRALVGRLLVLDGNYMMFNEFNLKKNPACPACS